MLLAFILSLHTDLRLTLLNLYLVQQYSNLELGIEPMPNILQHGHTRIDPSKQDLLLETGDYTSTDGKGASKSKRLSPLQIRLLILETKN